MKEGKVVLLAFGAALAGFVVAIGFERELVKLLGLDLAQLEWISDVVLASALGVATFLWLHLRRAQNELTRLERAQLVLDTELRIAAELQQSLLPPLPAARGGWRFAADLEPAGKVGGDFYLDRGDSLLLLLADVSGKGIPAAVAMGSCRTIFRELARDTEDLARLVARLSQALLEEHGGAPYLTCILARLDLAARSVSWVNAGHPAGVVVARGAHRPLAATGPPAGLLSGAGYEAGTLRLSPGEALVLVTDGVSEGLDGDDRVEERLARAIASPRARGAQAICDQLMRLARAGRERVLSGIPQDDRTVVVVTLEA